MIVKVTAVGGHDACDGLQGLSPLKTDKYRVLVDFSPLLGSP